MANATDVKRHRHRPVEIPLTDAMSPDIVENVTRSERRLKLSELKTLGDRVRWARQQLDLGSNDLTRLIRLPGGRTPAPGYVSSIETGKRKNIEHEHLVALARALGQTAEWVSSNIGSPRMGSGELPSMVTASKRDKANLESVLSAANAKSRWTADTVRAARAVSFDLESYQWPSVLDRLQTLIKQALGPIQP